MALDKRVASEGLDHPAPSAPLTTRQVLTLALMSIMAISTFLTFSIIAPFFPGEAYDKGMSVSEVGLVFAIYFVGVCVGSLLLGSVLTLVGPRFMYISGMFVRGSADIIFGFLVFAPSGTAFVVLCFIVRIVEALGAAAFMTAMFAIVAKEYPSRVASISGWLWACNAIGIMMGPPVGGFLYDIGGFTFPFLTLGCLMLLITFVSVFTMPDFKDDLLVAGGKEEKKVLVFSLLRNPSVVINCLCALLMYGPICFVEISLELLLQPFDLSAGMVGLVFTCEMGAYALFSSVVGQINNTWFYPRFQQVLGCLIYGIAYLNIGPSPLLPFQAEIWTICVCLVGIGIGASSINSAFIKDNIRQAIADGHPDTFDTHGLVSGLNICAITTGAFLGTFVGSSVSEIYEFPVASTMYAFIMWFVSLVVVVYKVFESRIQQHRKYKRLLSEVRSGDVTELYSEQSRLLPGHNRTAVTAEEECC